MTVAMASFRESPRAASTGSPHRGLTSRPPEQYRNREMLDNSSITLSPAKQAIIADIQLARGCNFEVDSNLDQKLSEWRCYQCSALVTPRPGPPCRPGCRGWSGRGQTHGGNPRAGAWGCPLHCPCWQDVWWCSQLTECQEAEGYLEWCQCSVCWPADTGDISPPVWSFLVICLKSD